MKYESNPIGYTSNPAMDKPLVFISVLCIVLIATGIYLFPDLTNKAAQILFDWVSNVLGSSIQLLVLAAFFICVYLCISKYGNIKLGNQKPEYKTIPWLFMFLCAGIGSSVFYWATIEWVYYYQTPALGLQPYSREALTSSLSFSFFHWGIGPCSTFAIASVAMAYHLHVRKNKGLSLSGMVVAIFKVKSNSIAGKIVDIIFLVSSVGALTISLVISVVILSIGISTLFDIPDSFATQAIIMIISATMFCLSSYIGIEKGMQSLSSILGYGALILAIIILIIGPTEFITNNIINSLGLILNHYFELSLATDPFGSGEFSKGWTVYYWLWWISYAPAVALFAARVSAGRSIREVILAFLLGTAPSLYFLFGVFESYSIYEFFTGSLDVVGILEQKGGEAALVTIFLSLPFGKFFLAALLFLMVILLAAHLDAVAYAMAATSTHNLAEGEDPTRHMKLFWCGVLTLIPLAILYINAPLSTLKTSAVLSGLVFLLILLIILFGFIRWLLIDYAHIPPHMIDNHIANKEVK